MKLLGVERCPTEVLDHIIDFLHEDKPTLTSCSLVCRNWASSARFHLFYSIRIAGAGPTKLEAFSGLLASAPYIGYYVQELHIRAGDGPAKITTATLSIILKALVRIRVLDVRCTYCHFDGLFPPPLLTLRKLVMQFVEVDTPPAKFISILGLCPNLKELDIRKSWWASQISFPEEPKTSVMPYLESLTLGNCRFSSLTSYLQVLRSNLPLSNLTSLDIVCLSPNDVSVIGGLLRDMGSKLLHLRLRMGSLLLQGTTPELSCETLGIDHCTSLKTFGILASSYGAVYTLLRLVFLLLQSLTSPSLSRITIGFVTVTDESGCGLLRAILAALPWSEVEHTLMGYQDLKEVKFLLERDLVLDGSPVPLDDKTKEIVLKKFPVLYKRGILHVFEGPSSPSG